MFGSMKLFISWSGERSKQIALAFRHWLPTIIQSIKPWMSEVDMGKGGEWNLDLSKELEGTALGLFCLTPENLNAPWLLFEAGAIGKRPGIKRVFTYLYELEDSDVPWPLAQFQSTKSSKDEMRQMLMEMNKHLTEPLDTQILHTSFERGWDELEELLITVSVREAVAPQKDKVELMLEEILTYVREQSRREQENATVAVFDRYFARLRSDDSLRPGTPLSNALGEEYERGRREMERRMADLREAGNRGKDLESGGES